MAREQAAANLHVSSENDWEDIDEEPIEEEEQKDLIMQGKRISMHDLANMFEFSMRTQLMMGRSRLRFYNDTNTIKAGKVKFPKTVLWRNNQ